MFNRIDLAPGVKRNNWPAIFIIFIITYSALQFFSVKILSATAWQNAPLSQFFFILLNPGQVDAPLSEFIELYAYAALALGIPLALSVVLAWMTYTPGGRDAYNHLSGPRRYDNKAAIKMGSALMRQEIVNDDIGEGVRIHPQIPYPFSYERYNYLLTGAPRSGKTTIMSYLVDQAVGRKDKVVLFDPAKRELTQMYYNPETCYLLAPWDKRSDAWAIAKDCQTQIEAESVAEKFIPLAGSDPMWPNAARLVTAGLIIYLQMTRGKEWGWEHLDACLSFPVEKLEQIFDEHYPFVRTFVEAESVTTQGILINIKAYVGFIKYFAKAWANSWETGLSLKEWAKDYDEDRNTLIIQTHSQFETLSSAMNQLALSFIGDTILELAGSKTRRCWLVVDELGSFKHEKLVQYMSILPGLGAVFVFIYQTPHLLYQNFEEHQIDGMEDMITTKVTLRNPGIKSAKVLSEQLGERKVSYMRHTRNGDTATSSVEEETIPLVEPSEITGLPVASVKGGIHGFLQIAGTESLFKITWPIDTSRPQKVAKPYIEAAWVKKAEQIEAKATKHREKLSDPEVAQKAADRFRNVDTEEEAQHQSAKSKNEIEFVPNESDQQTDLNPDALAAAEGAEEVVETFMSGAGADLLAGGIEAISMAELASDLLADDIPKGDLIHHKPKKKEQER
ncbi:MAG: type IV secretion system DNA-binding domain-containing protein [Candidatus Thiodiazotropha endolucinida]|nr:type IV secretion system DNA-binding domain-containing protein [Candidatus Thiodiazotropha taylori]MCG8095363.1 type IV secretion system DNA-binding domain-containing protein [Candidatus Thiodiazotropha endolucinida]MCG7882917.1 type IV secretion system DNA-binding domain-containing protein [Candidatus Thiodiazotropha taylori]MCG7892269.1 type IV secretion system DNA-binding domain-containing protein [Candidatus Thiodiazotropha taylori]MCG7953339.1 type IV secretion system DNA-binding domain